MCFGHLLCGVEVPFLECKSLVGWTLNVAGKGLNIQKIWPQPHADSEPKLCQTSNSCMMSQLPTAMAITGVWHVRVCSRPNGRDFLSGHIPNKHQQCVSTRLPKRERNTRRKLLEAHRNDSTLPENASRPPSQYRIDYGPYKMDQSAPQKSCK